MSFDNEYDDLLAKRERRDSIIKWLVVMGATTLVLGVLAILVFAQPDSAKGLKAVENAGFTNAHVIESGIVTLKCNDDYYYRVRAKNPAGNEVEVFVCCGVFKACTVRF